MGNLSFGYSVSRWFNESYILTSQKILQEQYFKDFQIPFVLGRSNYVCQKNSAMTCELGACFGNRKNMCTKTVNGKKMISCPYLVEREKCLSSNYSNLNYSYFLSLIGWKNSAFEENPIFRKLIVCDECHNIANELLNQCTVKLDEKLLQILGLKTKLPIAGSSDPVILNWLFTELFEEMKSEFLYLVSQISALSGMKVTREYKKISVRYSNMRRLLESIKTMKMVRDKGEIIVITQNFEYVEFRMLHCNTLFKTLLDDKADKFLFMSASVLDPKTFISDLGIDESLTEYIECDSVFPVENRLIHYVPVGSMSYKNKAATLPKMISKIDKILKENKNVKGIIHTVNYDIAEKIINGLAFSDQSYRLIMPKGANKQLLLNAFYNSDKPYVLISPSLTEGIDLKEDLSRLCIICKVPYGNLGDKWTKLRMNESQRWYRSQACMQLIQMSGRSIRSETDYATTYILDSDFIKLAENAEDILPSWWKEAVVID